VYQEPNNYRSPNTQAKYKPDDLTNMFSGLNLNEKNYMYNPNAPQQGQGYNNYNINQMQGVPNRNDLGGVNPQYGYQANSYVQQPLGGQPQINSYNNNMSNYDYNMMIQEQYLRNMQEQNLSPQE
jgi:hypothetical protein